MEESQENTILFILSNFFQGKPDGNETPRLRYAPLGVTGCTAVIPTGATNAVRSGMEESQENTILFIL